MTIKMTAQDLLAQKTKKRDEFYQKHLNSLRLSKQYAEYAQTALNEFEMRDEQVESMKRRIEDGLKARAEADELRGPHIASIDAVKTVEESKALRESEAYQTTKARILKLDTFYHDTTKEVALINNGTRLYVREEEIFGPQTDTEE